MRSNPLSRGAVSVTLGHSRRVKPLLALIATIAALALPAVASAGLATITFQDVPLHGKRAPAREHAGPVRSRRCPLARERQRALQRPLDAGRWGPWLDAAAEEEDQPDAGLARGPASRGWRIGNPTWVGPANGIRYRISGRVRDLRASFVRSPELKIPLRAVASAGSPPIVPRSAWGADESIRRAEPLYAPTIRFASVHHTAGTNNYSPAQAAAIMRGDRGLPRQVQRLERHRLQLPRRPLRHRLRGPLRRHRQERDRRVHARLQHRLARRRGDRDVRHAADSGRGRGVAREAARLAARSRARRSRLVAHVRLGRERALQRRRSRRASGRLGAPRHRTDLVPGRPPLREARHDRREDGGDRAAEALRAEGHGRPRRARSASRRASRRRCLEGDRQRRPRPAASMGTGRGRPSTTAGTPRSSPRPASAGGSRWQARPPSRERSGRASSPAPRDHRSRRRSRHDQPERRRRRDSYYDHLHDERRRHRHRNAPRRERRSAGEIGPRRASRPASTRSPSTVSVSPTASTRSCSRRSTRRASPSRASSRLRSPARSARPARAGGVDAERRRHRGRARRDLPARRSRPPCGCGCCGTASGSRRRTRAHSRPARRASPGTAPSASARRPTAPTRPCSRRPTRSAPRGLAPVPARRPSARDQARLPAARLWVSEAATRDRAGQRLAAPARRPPAPVSGARRHPQDQDARRRRTRHGRQQGGSPPTLTGRQGRGQ